MKTEKNLTSDIKEQENDKVKPYQKPAIIHELELEVHAGSPVDDNPLDLLNE